VDKNLFITLICHQFECDVVENRSLIPNFFQKKI